MGHGLGYGVGGNKGVKYLVEVLVQLGGVDEKVYEDLVDLLEVVFWGHLLQHCLQVECL